MIYGIHGMVVKSVVKDVKTAICTTLMAREIRMEQISRC